MAKSLFGFCFFEENPDLDFKRIVRIVKVRVVAFNNWVNVNYSRGTGISKKVAWFRLEFAEVQQLSDRCKKTNLMVHFV